MYFLYPSAVSRITPRTCSSTSPSFLNSAIAKRAEEESTGTPEWPFGAGRGHVCSFWSCPSACLVMNIGNPRIQRSPASERHQLGSFRWRGRFAISHPAIIVGFRGAGNQGPLGLAGEAARSARVEWRKSLPGGMVCQAQTAERKSLLTSYPPSEFEMFE